MAKANPKRAAIEEFQAGVEAPFSLIITDLNTRRTEDHFLAFYRAVEKLRFRGDWKNILSVGLLKRTFFVIVVSFFLALLRRYHRSVSEGVSEEDALKYAAYAYSIVNQKLGGGLDYVQKNHDEANKHRNNLIYAAENSLKLPSPLTAEMWKFLSAIHNFWIQQRHPD